MPLSWVSSFSRILLLAQLSIRSRYPLIAALLGATSVLVFGVLQIPPAQPRNVIGENQIGACVGIALIKSLGIEPRSNGGFFDHSYS